MRVLNIYRSSNNVDIILYGWCYIHQACFTRACMHTHTHSETKEKNILSYGLLLTLIAYWLPQMGITIHNTIVCTCMYIYIQVYTIINTCFWRFVFAYLNYHRYIFIVNSKSRLIIRKRLLLSYYSTYLKDTPGP